MRTVEISPPAKRYYSVVPAPTSTSSPTGSETATIWREESSAAEPERLPLRNAWVEINLAQLRRNFRLIQADKPAALKLMSVVKDDGYGHGILEVARMAVEQGATHVAVSTLHEAMILRDAGFKSPILLLGERHDSELPWCAAHDLTVCLNDATTAEALARAAARASKRVPVHVKVDTGMARYGVRWDAALPLIEFIAREKSLLLEGVMSHFSQSDEQDKGYARLQHGRFLEVLEGMAAAGIAVRHRHICNSGGFLDLPQAHHDMVRIGILPLGVFPSQVCRRIEGIRPVMTVKTRVSGIRTLHTDECVGYGMHYRAADKRRIAVLPVGYGDGYPRLRNKGQALIAGRRAPVVGGNAMDATMVDITDIPEAGLWSEAVLMGRQGHEEITARDVAQWKGTVSYEVLVGWRSRLPRVYLDE
ncbi:MAG: alanine racemase [Verrucomicrobia bacterium]|jgi:alanine racemase|nr:alanine racemase [Verrucomicrobiota bacterium]